MNTDHVWKLALHCRMNSLRNKHPKIEVLPVTAKELSMYQNAFYNLYELMMRMRFEAVSAVKKYVSYNLHSNHSLNFGYKSTSNLKLSPRLLKESSNKARKLAVWMMPTKKSLT